MSSADRPMDAHARRIREAESGLFAGLDGGVEERFLDLSQTNLRVRTLSCGSGAPLLLLHGVSFSSASWAPLLAGLGGFRVLAVDLPGHGLSDPVRYRPGQVREHTHRLITDIVDALELDAVPVVGHSLGAMFALWEAAAGSERVSQVIAVGAPAVALPGVRVRMPLSPLTVPGLGVAMLRSPSPRSFYRRLLTQGLGPVEMKLAPDLLIEALRLASRRPENARTVASLMHAIDHFRRPRAESVLTAEELAAIQVPTHFILGSDDPYLSPTDARPSIARIPNATFHEMAAGHAPFLVDPPGVARMIRAQLAAHASDDATHLAARAVG